MTLNVEHHNGIHTITGSDDLCGTDTHSRTFGIAFIFPDERVGLGVTTVLPDGTPIHLDGDFANDSHIGTWRDSSGNRGTLLITTGPSTGGPPRPMASGGVRPGSITATQLAPGAVGPSAIGANAVTGANVADGSLTVADLRDAARVAYASVDGEGASTGSLAVEFRPIRRVTIVVPAPGHVIVNASGTFRRGLFALRGEAICVLNGPGPPGDEAMVHVANPNLNSAIPFALTGGFAVSAGPNTFTLLCRVTESVGALSVGPGASITALYVPGS